MEVNIRSRSRTNRLKKCDKKIHVRNGSGLSRATDIIEKYPKRRSLFSRILKPESREEIFAETLRNEKHESRREALVKLQHNIDKLLTNKHMKNMLKTTRLALSKNEWRSLRLGKLSWKQRENLAKKLYAEVEAGMRNGKLDPKACQEIIALANLINPKEIKYSSEDKNESITLFEKTLAESTGSRPALKLDYDKLFESKPYTGTFGADTAFEKFIFKGDKGQSKIIIGEKELHVPSGREATTDGKKKFRNALLQAISEEYTNKEHRMKALKTILYGYRGEETGNAICQSIVTESLAKTISESDVTKGTIDIRYKHDIVETLVLNTDFSLTQKFRLKESKNGLDGAADITLPDIELDNPYDDRGEHKKDHGFFNAIHYHAEEVEKREKEESGLVMKGSVFVDVTVTYKHDDENKFQPLEVDRSNSRIETTIYEGDCPGYNYFQMENPIDELF